MTFARRRGVSRWCLRHVSSCDTYVGGIYRRTLLTPLGDSQGDIVSVRWCRRDLPYITGVMVRAALIVRDRDGVGRGWSLHAERPCVVGRGLQLALLSKKVAERRNLGREMRIRRLACKNKKPGTRTSTPMSLSFVDKSGLFIFRGRNRPTSVFVWVRLNARMSAISIPGAMSP